MEALNSIIDFAGFCLAIGGTVFAGVRLLPLVEAWTSADLPEDSKSEA